MRAQHAPSQDSRRAEMRTTHAAFAFAFFASSTAHAADPRSMMLGIAAVPTDNGYIVFFSSSGLPPTGASANGD